MIENFWKQSDLINNFPQAQSLQEITGALTQWAHEKGRVVCSFTVNGVPLSETEEQKFSKTRISDVMDITLLSSTPENLLDESLMECKEYVRKVIHVYERLVLLFREKDLSYAHRLHQNAMEGIETFTELIIHYRIVHNACRGDLGAQWDRLQLHIPVVLDQILKAHEKKDYNLVADLLEYEMLGLLEDWKKEIDQLCTESANNFTESPTC